MNGLKRFASALVLIVIAAASLHGEPPTVRSVAITFDDLPGVVHGKGSNLTAIQTLNWKILDTLKKHGVPATGFVIESKVQEGDPGRVRASVLEGWVRDGMSLGNHSYSHLDYDKVSTATYERDVYAAEATVRPLMQKYHKQLRFFRYPFNHLGDTAEKKSAMLEFLAKHHYELATCTIENADWMFDVGYHDAMANHDAAAMRRIREAYLQTTDAAFQFYEKRSKVVIGREFPQVLLLHANELNAEMLDDVLTLIEKRGYKFKDLAEVQSDPAYQSKDDYVGPYGWMWTERWAIAKKIAPAAKESPDPPTWILNEYSRLTR